MGQTAFWWGLQKALFLLILLPLANAQYFESYYIEVDASKEVTETITVNITNKIQIPIETINFILTKSSEMINVEGGSYQKVQTDRGLELKVTPQNTINPGGSALLKISFKAAHLVRNGGENEVFKIAFTASSEIKNFQVSLKLPKGGNVALDGNSPIASPSPLLTTNGENIILSWSKQLTKDETFAAIALFSGPKRDYSSVFPIAAIAIFVIIAVYMHNTKKTAKVMEGTLDEDDRKIFDYIKEKNEVTQDDVVHFTGFSKSKVSKLIRRLEEHKMIEKEPYKKTNKLKLAKSIA